MTSAHVERSLPVALRAGAGLAAAMGIGRFVYTPLLPLMQEQAHLSHANAALLATVNYLGYLIGAVALTVRPQWSHSQRVFRSCLALLVISELAMAATTDFSLWSIARLVAGAASAVVFVGCAQAVAGSAAAGLAYGGVGAGIALSGLLVVGLEDLLSWRLLWVVSGALAALLTVPAWSLSPKAAVPRSSVVAGPARAARAWTLLFTSYFLEAVGYIILGTFLVAAVSAGGVRWTGPAAWAVVGLAAAAAPVLWGRFVGRWPSATLLAVALLLQTVSAVLPALVGGVVAAGVSAVLFGGTFIPAVMFSMELGARLRMPRYAALLTTGYAIGQVLGPVVVTPLLAGGYERPFIVAAGILALAATSAALLRADVRRRQLGPPSSRLST